MSLVDENPAAMAEPAAAPHYNAAASLKLSPFWSDTPATWFTMAECQFHLRRITDEQDRFCILVAALSKESIRLVTNIIEDPLQNPYTTLKVVLLKSHQLTDFQRVEKLHQLEPLSGCKPSELLAVMLEICPRGQDTSLFFQYLFLQHLPRELRIIAAEDDHTDLRRTAEKANTLWAIHTKQSHDVVAAVDIDSELVENTVVAIPGRGNNRGNTRGGGSGSRARGGGCPPNANQHDQASTPQSLAQQSAGLCFFHWSIGKKATKCRSPCSWQGNLLARVLSTPYTLVLSSRSPTS